jgi:hypothetical protein
MKGGEKDLPIPDRALTQALLESRSVLQKIRANVG